MKRLLSSLLAILLILTLSACGKTEPDTSGVTPVPSDGSESPVPLLPRPDPNTGASDFPPETTPRFDLGSSQVSESHEPEHREPPEEEPKVITGPDGKKYLNNRIMVSFTGTVTEGQIIAFADEYKGTLASEKTESGAFQIDLDDPLSYDDLYITATRMKTNPIVLETWLEPIPEFNEGSSSSSSNVASSESSEAPPAIVSSKENVLIYDKSPDIPDVDPYAGSDGGSRS